ncbi:MAG: sulfatase-modifying factor protein [Acidobacteria bacterium]|nr:MAG: sulfatase-modifying factor protein [Acidobacteriota bacterium]
MFRKTFVLASILIAALYATAAADRQSPTASTTNYTETIPGTAITFDMVFIPGGTFKIGSPPSEPGRSTDEGPQQTVQIRPFWMERTEVTWDEFDAFAFAQAIAGARAGAPAAPPSGADAITRPTPPYADESFGYGKGRQPVISIQHHAAMEYCRWLSAKTGRAYRLPTEAEWEYAARAGSTSAYAFGDNPAALGAASWYSANADGHPHLVGTKAANRWGLHDMHGNVAEWCLDRYEPDAYSRLTPGTIGPVLLPTDRRYPHVARGGSWDDDAARLRSAARRASSPNWNRRDPQSPQSIWWFTDATFVGLRVVRAVEEQDNLKGIQSRITKDSQEK